MTNPQVNSALKSFGAQQMILIVSMIIMVAGLIFLHPAYRAFLGFPYAAIILGDVAALMSPKSETLKRLMLVLSVVGALSSAFFIYRDLI
ncbi:hypothetical protein [Streptomyces scabiei]|uniref:hypothetical protein n=1 Tax=Streptomyces scabiei TaxID=1930 RepID=UPI0029BE2EB4|nr:hypothetical protein [Streptomyces scabiei]MDX3277320.1 hypothetical protein [Streptomyces scabiei]